MAPETLQRELWSIGRKLSSWQAEVHATFLTAILLGSIWLFSTSDIFLRYQFTGRIITWSILMGLFVFSCWQIFKAWNKQHSVEGVAAQIEHTFPFLDNHLINHVQFAARANPNALESAYLQHEIPEWNQVNIGDLKNKKKQLRSFILLSSICVILLATATWSGAAWTNALLRILNPFSKRPPTTLAVIESVKPGNSHVLTGNPVNLVCSVSGKKGHNVSLELWPADDKPSTTILGNLTGSGEEEFSYHIPEVSTELAYRFRAGDAISSRYRISVLIPLALTKMAVTVKPPAYTRLEHLIFDGLADTIPIPFSSTIALAFECNRELNNASIITTNSEPIACRYQEDSNKWHVQFPITEQQKITILATDPYKTTLETSLKYELLPDQPPVIHILVPTERTVLMPGASPRIDWEISDDFGLSKIMLKQVIIKGSARKTKRTGILQEWSLAGEKHFETKWEGKKIHLTATEPFAVKVVAIDNQAGKPNYIESPVILFDLSTSKNIEKKKKEIAHKATTSLGNLVTLQRKNLEQTQKLDAVIKTTKPAQWEEVTERQNRIRQIAGQLVADPRKPLGSLGSSTRKLYNTTMKEAINVLKRIPYAEAPLKTSFSSRALMLEKHILQVLTRINSGMDKINRNHTISGILGMLNALVKGQETTLIDTKASLKQQGKMEEYLSEKQDRLAGDLSTFTQSCQKNAELLSGCNPEFGKLLTQVADGCKKENVYVSMLRAAEHLENKFPAKAIPHQIHSLASLKLFQQLMNEWRAKDARKTANQLAETLHEASDKLKKLMDVEAKVVDAIRETKRQKDKSGKEFDMLNEDLLEEINELNKNVQEALLKIATDLQIFPELPVGNDMVEDIFQVFEEMKQAEGSEKTAAHEIGLQKEDWIMDQMEAMQKTKERLDDMEMWLQSAPDSEKKDVEAFDQEEIPKVPIAPLPTELEDIIGDLLEQEEDIAEESHDSAVNQGTSDFEAGWRVEEGEWVNYSAKGKSGNVAPDHKEQDGRSAVGREGMSDGESVAASGKIGEGDKNIEKRMTQDPSQAGQAMEEDHSEAVATGGGKQSGYSDRFGMSGSGPRRDSKVRKGSEAGLQAMLRRNAQAVYAKAQLSHIRTGSLDDAIYYMELAEDAIVKGYSIHQVSEFQRLSVAALKKTQTELGSEAIAEAIDLEHRAPAIDDQLAGTRDEAPPAYKKLVSEYFKSLSALP